MKKNIETEYKLELNLEEFDRVQNKLIYLGFSFVKKTILQDYFFDVEKFDEKGYDFKRIRVYDDTVFEQTVKKWRLIENGDRIRDEFEIIVDREYLDNEKLKSNFLKLDKERVDFNGKVLGFEAIVSLDKTNIKGNCRYFIEIELKNVEENESREYRLKSRDWMLSNLELTSREEGIGMMKLVLESL